MVEIPSEKLGGKFTRFKPNIVIFLYNHKSIVDLSSGIVLVIKTLTISNLFKQISTTNHQQNKEKHGIH